MNQKGDWLRWSKVQEVQESGAQALPEIEHRLSELDDLIREASSREERTRLRDEQPGLLDLRDQKRNEPGRVVEVWNPSKQYFSELWAAAGDEVTERRAVLQDALERVVVRRGRPGRRTAGDVLERLQVTWKRPEELGAAPAGGLGARRVGVGEETHPLGTSHRVVFVPELEDDLSVEVYSGRFQLVREPDQLLPRRVAVEEEGQRLRHGRALVLSHDPERTWLARQRRRSLRGHKDRPVENSEIL